MNFLDFLRLYKHNIMVFSKIYRTYNVLYILRFENGLNLLVFNYYRSGCKKTAIKQLESQFKLNTWIVFV